MISFGIWFSRLFAIIITVFVVSSSSTVFAIDTSTPAGRIQYAENNPIASMLCRAFKGVTNTIIKAICVLIIIITGIGFLLGKVSWGIVISLGIGVGITLGATSMPAIFIGDAGTATLNGKTDVCGCAHGVSCPDG